MKKRVMWVVSANIYISKRIFHSIVNMSERSETLDILKMEYQSCRNKVDDLDNFLKDIRFKGITIITGFIGGIGLMFNLEYFDATIIMSISTILLIFHLWRYDHKYSMFLVGAVKRAQEIEDRLEKIVGDVGGKMLSHVLSDVYRKLPGHVAIISSSLYSLLSIIGLGILLFSAHLKQISLLFWLIIVLSIIFILLILHMWYLRNKAEDWFKWPTLPKFKKNNKKS
jgi:hypothetical protein